ncbi:MAG: nitronate monooxygenase [Holophaga sp.]|jgi:nitronate monooxygenase
MGGIRNRVETFCARFGLRMPILLAPMAGASATALSIAVMRAGGLGACGALLMGRAEILAWAREVRAGGGAAFQINLWIPGPRPRRNAAQEARVRTFLEAWGPPVPAEAGDAEPPDFQAQCDALLAAGAPIVSSVMGLFPPRFVTRLKAAGVAWFATASTLAEARAAEAAGADAVVVQGMEAGGHRGCFNPARAEQELVGLFSLVPAVADAVRIPVVASGGIADGRGVAAALALGASAVQIGTGFLRCPEAGIAPAWADALAAAAPESTRISRVFSGRPGRSLFTAYVLAVTAPGAPVPAPYPVQRGLTAAMRKEGMAQGDLARIQAWAGQSAALARAEPAEPLARRIWEEAGAILEGGETTT